MKRSSSKPSARRRKRIQSDPAVILTLPHDESESLGVSEAQRRRDCQMRTAGSGKKKPAEAELNVQLLLMAATAFYLLPPLLCLVAGFAQGWPGFAHEQMFSECDLRAKLDEKRNAHALESARFFFKRIRLRRRK